MEIDWKRFLSPKSIVVIGASADPNKNSGRIIPALKQAGFSGAIWAVNPNTPVISGATSIASVDELPPNIDVALVSVPAQLVNDVIKMLAGKSVAVSVIFSSGFSEIGGHGISREKELRATVGCTTMRIYGPNCPGVWMVADKMAYTFSPLFHPDAFIPGPIGLVTQGGALGRAVLDAMSTGLGFSYWFSPGNEADLTVADFISYLADEPRTRVVAAVIEGIRDGGAFLDAARKCRDNRKPLVVLKLGRTQVGGIAARSHTGSLTGSDVVHDVAFNEAGVIRVDDIDELVDLVRLLSDYSAPAEPGLGICGFSGGSGALAADVASRAGVRIPPLSHEVAKDLRTMLPEIASVSNPADMTTAIFQKPELVSRVLRLFVDDSPFGAVLFPFPYKLGALNTVIAESIVGLRESSNKPIAALALSADFESEDAYHILRAGRIPIFRSATKAAVTLARFLGNHGQGESSVGREDPYGKVLDEGEGRRILAGVWKRGLGIETIETASVDGVLDAAQMLGLPVVLKGVGAPGVSHKAKNGLVRLNLTSLAQVRQAFAEMEASSKRPTRYLVQRMQPDGVDLLVGVRRDPTFGWTMAVGAGGTLAEYVGDIAMTLLPIERDRLQDLLHTLKIFPWLNGQKDGVKRDVIAIEELLQRVAHIPEQIPSLCEFEINPVRVFEEGKGVAVLDVLAIVDDERSIGKVL